MDIGFILLKLIIILGAFAISLGVGAYATLVERKVAGFFQDRLGPNRAGPFGILQPLADGLKMFFKEESMPTGVHKFLFIIAPGISIGLVLMVSAVLPWGDTLIIGGETYELQVTDLNVGLLYVLGVISLSVYGILLGGWASNNKYSLMGALRASSQVISYEISMGIALLALLLSAGSLSFKDIVAAQHGGDWNVLHQPFGFLIFLVCAFAESKRVPFDLPECEAELIGGYHTEYSSMKLAFFLFAEYIGLFISSILISSLYFGGYNFPFMDSLGLSHNVLTIVGSCVLIAKAFFFMFVFMWIRWTLPRFRYDQLMRLGWQILIPLSLLNLFATAAIKLFL